MGYTIDQLKQMTIDTANQYGLDTGIGLAQIYTESRFNPLAVSPVGAKGLAQFMDGTWHHYGHGSPFDPVAALDAWARYMTDLLHMFGGDYAKALAGYNGGPGKVQEAVSAWGSDWLSHLKAAETRNYVATILAMAPSFFPKPPLTGVQPAGAPPETQPETEPAQETAPTPDQPIPDQC